MLRTYPTPESFSAWNLPKFTAKEQPKLKHQKKLEFQKIYIFYPKNWNFPNIQWPFLEYSHCLIPTCNFNFVFTPSIFNQKKGIYCNNEIYSRTLWAYSDAVRIHYVVLYEGKKNFFDNTSRNSFMVRIGLISDCSFLFALNYCPNDHQTRLLPFNIQLQRKAIYSVIFSFGWIIAMTLEISLLNISTTKRDIISYFFTHWLTPKQSFFSPNMVEFWHPKFFRQKH